jgi:hypothetical protein
VPRIKSECPYPEAARLLDQELRTLAQLASHAPIRKISESDAQANEWDQFRPEARNRRPVNRPILSLKLNPGSTAAARDIVIRPGDIQFVPRASSQEVVSLLSEMIARYYTLGKECDFAIAPILWTGLSVGEVYDFDDHCHEDSEGGSLTDHAVSDPLAHQPLGLDTPRNRIGDLDSYWNLKTGSQTTREFEGYSVTLADSSPLLDIGSNDNQGVHGTYLLSEIRLKGEPIAPGSGPGTSPGRASRACDISNFETFLSKDRDLSGCNLAGVDLSGRDLSGVNFSNANLEGTILLGTGLDGANLTGARLKGAVHNAMVLPNIEISPSHPYGPFKTTRFPESIRFALDSQKMVPYEECELPYDQFCRNSPENPYDCLQKVIGGGEDVPAVCAALMQRGGI